MIYKDIQYDIVKSYGIIGDDCEIPGFVRELNLISWNGGMPKIDIRGWKNDHSAMTRGLTLNITEYKRLRMLLQEWLSKPRAEKSSEPASDDASQTQVCFDILDYIGVLSVASTGWSKELNFVSWNNDKPKLDIREWDCEHNHMSRGIRLDIAEAERIMSLVKPSDVEKDISERSSEDETGKIDTETAAAIEAVCRLCRSSDDWTQTCEGCRVNELGEERRKNE